VLKIGQASQQQIPQLQQAVPVRTASETCRSNDVGPGRTLVSATKVVRPVRNLTPYHVSVSINHVPVLVVPPCYGPSMLPTPVDGFTLEAVASLPTSGGQKQVSLKVVPSSSADGWDIVMDGVLEGTSAN